MRKTGRKFGLIGSASSIKKTGGARVTGKPPPQRRFPNTEASAIFGAESDGDDDDGTGREREDPNGVKAVNRRLAAVAAKQDARAEKEYAAAMAENPTLFDYDRVYDAMKESGEQKKVSAEIAREKEKHQPKYIGNLLKQAELRKVEADRIFDRKLQKEREEQDKVEGEATMKFVTSSYKKKLMEQKKWELQQQLEVERETRMGVEKAGMSSFYSNLMSKNIAMGGDVDKLAQSAFTTGSKRHQATTLYDMEAGMAGGRAGEWDEKGKGRDESNGQQEQKMTRKEGEGGNSDADKDMLVPSARMRDPRGLQDSGRSERAENDQQGTVGEGHRGEGDGVTGDGDTRGEGKRKGYQKDKVEGKQSEVETQHCQWKDVERGDSGVRFVEENAGDLGYDNGSGGKRPRWGPEAGEGMGKNDRVRAGEGESTSNTVSSTEVLAENSAVDAVAEKERKVTEARLKKEAAIRAAKERYMARKKS